jgi:hypothetical protein
LRAAATSAAARPPGSAPTRTLEPPTGPPHPEGPRPASLDDLLDQDGQVPDGVAEQIDWFSGGGSECPVTDTTGDLHLAVHDVLEIPSLPVICIRKFADADLTLVITTPTGAESTMTLPASTDIFDSVTYRLAPGSALGRYRIHAAQNKETSTAEFVVRRARKPTIWVDPYAVSPGLPVDVFLGGFPARRPADLHLYVCRGGAVRYRATHRVMVDAVGEAHLVLHTSRRTTPTCYFLINLLAFDPGKLPETGSPPHLSFWVRN